MAFGLTDARSVEPLPADEKMLSRGLAVDQIPDDVGDRFSTLVDRNSSENWM
jgi:hypothetical protein